MRLFRVIKQLFEEHERRMRYAPRLTPDEFLANCAMGMLLIFLLVYHNALVEIFLR